MHTALQGSLGKSSANDPTGNAIVCGCRAFALDEMHEYTTALMLLQACEETSVFLDKQISRSAMLHSMSSSTYSFNPRKLDSATADSKFDFEQTAGHTRYLEGEVQR
jgi:hypothetical protein